MPLAPAKSHVFNGRPLGRRLAHARTTMVLACIDVSVAYHLLDILNKAPDDASASVRNGSPHRRLRFGRFEHGSRAVGAPSNVVHSSSLASSRPHRGDGSRVNTAVSQTGHTCRRGGASSRGSGDRAPGPALRGILRPMI